MGRLWFVYSAFHRAELALLVLFMHTDKRSFNFAQCDDDVASIVGLNCPRLEGIVLTGTNVTNVGLSWLLCCRNLHTIIMQVRLNPSLVVLHQN